MLISKSCVKRKVFVQKYLKEMQSIYATSSIIITFLKCPACFKPSLSAVCSLPHLIPHPPWAMSSPRQQWWGHLLENLVNSRAQGFNSALYCHLELLVRIACRVDLG